jgi:hypothetical protein
VKVGRVLRESSTWDSYKATTFAKNYQGVELAQCREFLIPISPYSPVAGVGTCLLSTLTPLASTVTHCSEGPQTCAPSTISIKGPTSFHHFLFSRDLHSEHYYSDSLKKLYRHRVVQTCPLKMIVSMEMISGLCSPKPCKSSMAVVTSPISHVQMPVDSNLTAQPQSLDWALKSHLQVRVRAPLLHRVPALYQE